MEYAVVDKSKKKKKKGDKQQNVSSLRTIRVCLPYALYAEGIQLQYSCALVYVHTYVLYDVQSHIIPSDFLSNFSHA